MADYIPAVDAEFNAWQPGRASDGCQGAQRAREQAPGKETL
jgi:hypothetical protein